MSGNQVPALTADEEFTWRALTYLVTHLRRALGDDLARETRVGLSEYVALVHLSEAENQRLNIGDLANMCDLSPSRMSRLVDEMSQRGLVSKSRSNDDGRCIVATLRPDGLKALKALYPKQLGNVRRRVFDLLSADEVQSLGNALGKVRDALAEGGFEDVPSPAET
jgi:DNA-binding MarR family transcriptional regulator